VRKFGVFLACLVLLTVLSGVASAEPTVEWTRSYDGGREDIGHGVAVDSADNVIVTGRSYLNGSDGYSMDYYTIKYDPDGNEIWEVAYDGEGNWDVAYAVAVDSADNVIVTGASSFTHHIWFWCFYTIKYDSDGNVLWTIKDSGTPNPEGYVRSNAYGVAVDSNDNVIVTGASGIENIKGIGNINYLTIKYDPDGNKLWNRTYDGGDTDRAFGLAIDSGDNIIVAGDSESLDGDADYYTIKYDSNGNELWARRYGSGEYEWANGVAVDSNDNVIVTGRERLSGDKGYLTIKYDPNGNEIWTRTYHYEGWDEAYGVAIDSNDNIIVTGSSDDVNEIGDDYTEDYCTIKYDSDGNVLWTMRYDSGGDDEAQGVTVDSADNIIVVGRTKVPSPYRYNYNWYTIKYTEITDSDNDGVPDSSDLCSGTPAGATVDSDGCSGSALEIIGVEGGTVTTDTGSVSLEIPAGALIDDTSISIDPDPTISDGFAIREGTEAVGYAYVFGPDGTTFEIPVILTMVYDEASVGNEDNLDIYLYNDGTGEWEAQGALVDTVANTLTLEMTHFSRYVVGEVVKVYVEVGLDPDTLNLNSKGVFTAYISPPEGYSVEDIDPETIECGGAAAVRTSIEDGVLVAKFSRQDLVDVSEGDAVELTVTGEVAGISFEGSDVVRVIAKGKK